MARRKNVTFGRSSEDWFEFALGFDHRTYFHQMTGTFQPPVLDFEKIRERTGVSLGTQSQADLNQGFGDYYSRLARSRLNLHDDDDTSIGAPVERSRSTSDFGTLTKKIEEKAAELERLVDELVEIDPGLACRPYDSEDFGPVLNISRMAVDKSLGALPRAHRLSQRDFSDYIAFRSVLDYLTNFLSSNEPYNNWYGARYSFEQERADFDFFIRRFIVVWQRDGLPISVTVPTDTNPEYESPLIAALLEVQEQHSSLVAPIVDQTTLHAATRNYRQLAYLSSGILKELAQSDLVTHSLMRELRR